MTKAIVYKTAKHPVVYAELIYNSSYKNVLFYGHYDVQPVNDAGTWKYPPFEPVAENNYMYARGASDDKGQLFTHILAIEKIIRNKIPVKVNIKCLFEGEEEIGSPNLKHFLVQNINNIKPDVVIVSDTRMIDINTPALTYSLRGALNAEIKIVRKSKEVHSGTFGGIVQNPLDIAAKIVAGINDENGKILLNDFYKYVKKINSDERVFMKKNGPCDNAMLRDAGSDINWGEPGWSNYERTTIRPSITVTSLSGGYTGNGIKNNIPSSVMIKLNMRLVKNQIPAFIAGQLKEFVFQNLPKNFESTIHFSSATAPVEISREHPYINAAVNAYKKVFKKNPSLIRSGGSIPVVSMFTNQFNTPVLMMGFATGSDNMHAANERFYLPNLFRGRDTLVYLLQNLGK